ncbi:hypothetical protein JYK21_30395 [Ralstonia pickettii]|nr:hypothetical protein [Ralstonia pickettii]
MPVTLTKARAPGDVRPRQWLILLLSFVLACWSLSSSASITGGGSMGAINWDYERMMNQTIRALPSSGTGGGIAIGGDGVARIGYMGKRIGQIAIAETATIGLGDLAAIAARSVNPAMIALMVGTLAVEGLSRCLQSQTGWCKKGQVNSNSTDSGFTGYQFCYAGGSGVQACGDSPGAACAAVVGGAGLSYLGLHPSDSPTYFWCRYRIADGTVYESSSAVSQQATCVKNYTVQAGACKPDSAAVVDPVPVAYPDIAAAWNRQMVANSAGLPDYWRAMTPDEQAQAAATAQTQPATINGSDTVSDPSAKSGTTTNTKPDGSAETCTTNTAVRVQARANTSSTMGSSPLNYQATTTNTRTCPSTGTTTQTGNQDSGDTGTQTGGGPASGVVGGGGGTQPKVELKTCGLADTGPCRIDESGTPTVADGKAAVSAAQSDLTQTRQDAQTNFTTVNQGRSFDLHMPHLLPGGTCQPVEWFSWGSWRGSWDPCDSMAYVRTLLSWLWYTLAAIYIWNRTASANAGAQ